jgi:uncharacterized protein YjbI with pentapeptide repeats
VINAGVSGGNSDSELRLVWEKLVGFSPDLVIVYDGWNDLKADYSVGYTKDGWYQICKIGKINDFDVIISLQPLAGFGNKKLTQQEVVNSLTGETHEGFQLIADKSTYDYMGRELLSLKGNCNVADLRGAFDDISGPIYWDQGHVSDAGNLIVAEKFYEIINEIIFNKKPTKSKFHDTLSKYNSPTIISYLLSKIGIDIDYTQIEKQNLENKDKKDGNYFYLKNQLGGSEKILVGKDLSKADLSKINLIGQDLSGTNLSGQDLRKIDLTDTILRGANLSFTNLSGKNLSGKDLRGINLHGANLENADLTNITLSEGKIEVFGNMMSEDLSGNECSHETDPLENYLRSSICLFNVIKNESIRTDFSNANLNGATISFVPSVVNFVDFSGADLTGIEFSNVIFAGCKFNGTNFSNSNMNEGSFGLCEFVGAEFNNSKFDRIVFNQVSFRNAKIIDGYLEEPVFVNVDFSNADFRGSVINQSRSIGDNTGTCKNYELCE